MFSCFYVQTTLSDALSVIDERLQFINALPPSWENSDYCITQLENIINFLNTTLRDRISVSPSVRTLRDRAIHLHYTWTNVSIISSTCTEPVRGACDVLTVDHLSSRNRGRPKLRVNLDQVELLRSSGFSWREVANAFLISRTTLWRRIKESGYQFSSFVDISDNDLDSLVRSFHHNHPQSGVCMLQGYLNSIGTHVQRERVRGSLSRVDPLGSVLRRHQTISRRRYCVPGPNSLWHIDGHHSLIRWGFVVHGGVDGYSRLIVYLYCSTNNRAQTVTELFIRANSLFGLPSRVRSDRGGENVGVCELMIRRRGLNRGSHIAGSSTHNQRIERLWRDVFRCVCSTFHSLFHYLEEMGVLDPENASDRYALQYIFTPRINQCLTEFACAWNHHPLRTERNWSPKKIWMNGVLDPNNQELTAIRDIVDPVPHEGLDLFGIDREGPLPFDLNEYTTVEVDDTECPLNETDRDAFVNLFDPLESCEDYGIDLYSNARAFVLSHLR